MIRDALVQQQAFRDLVTGHVDAAHGGVITPECDRCVTLAADAGLDIRPTR